MTDLLTRLPDTRPAVGPHLDAPASTLAGSTAGDLVIVVAPSTGRFRAAAVDGLLVGTGELLGHVTGGKGRADVVASPVAGQVARLLVRPGQLVARGQGLAWLQRSDLAAAG